MSLEKGILGYLSMKPLTGYDIHKLFNMSVGYFWPADQAQIYRCLKSLLKDGLVEQAAQRKNDRRKEYAITDKGREALHAWLLEVTFSDFVQRCPNTLHLFFSGFLNPEEQLALLDQQIEFNHSFVQKLKDNYVENGPAFAATVELSDPNRLLQSATLACKWGIYRGEAFEAFLKEIKAELSAQRELL